MTFTHIGKALLCVIIGVALLASVVVFVPGPYLILAAIIVLPIESALLALATAPRRNAGRSLSTSVTS